MKPFKEFSEQVAAGKTTLPIDLRSTEQKQREVDATAANIKKYNIKKISPD